jgi:hypothetical protein
MLRLRDKIVSEFPKGYVIGATDTTYGNVQIHIPSAILVEYLGSTTAVQNDRVEQLYVEKRALIEALAQKAFNARPGEDVELQASDFR